MGFQVFYEEWACTLQNPGVQTFLWLVNYIINLCKKIPNVCYSLFGQNNNLLVKKKTLHLWDSLGLN